ncbi:hypothetical protein TREMEDRAFT_63016 [Tremella mesenterica DSM 1558]|uniref:uncharacterized protein n=1 Tax=Tremella mesenterica (strain ATCC 24925 / CBS 8224 / DSM 1558 / NBRC 9311 / NRRL Y-6157 / RJB 2259-6 / UBC 559-6) TaxID=578456 RepID=UPI0003F49059|nr:uncharacterized protein TREMEDRAFT_63016 [Tremella mesenterica DSM 1558]EIW68550.1 hypothetical protein TREMEDRAFT_63016 [Tremella mesenterica DSM 1558]
MSQVFKDDTQSWPTRPFGVLVSTDPLGPMIYQGRQMLAICKNMSAAAKIIFEARPTIPTRLTPKQFSELKSVFQIGSHPLDHDWTGGPTPYVPLAKFPLYGWWTAMRLFELNPELKACVVSFVDLDKIPLYINTFEIITSQNCLPDRYKTQRLNKRSKLDLEKRRHTAQLYGDFFAYGFLPWNATSRQVEVSRNNPGITIPKEWLKDDFSETGPWMEQMCFKGTDSFHRVKRRVAERKIQLTGKIVHEKDNEVHRLTYHQTGDISRQEVELMFNELGMKSDEIRDEVNMGRGLEALGEFSEFVARWSR